MSFLSELRILVSTKEIEGLPSDVYKILLSEEAEIVINPRERVYVVGKPFNLSIENKMFQINPDKEIIKINGKEINLNHPLCYIVLRNGNISFEYYSSSEIFKKKYGFTGIT